ncbi:hypothetical protein [Burkholderia phage BCSR5]|nr:hypothetical protein [Burkholderia phage BCSR5]
MDATTHSTGTCLAPEAEAVQCFIDHYWPLRKRTKTWLQANPDELQRFISEFERDPFAHMDLDWQDKRAIEDFEFWQPYYQEKLKQDKILWSSAVVTNAHSELGKIMAQSILETANRGGFLRRVFYRGKDFDVPEFTREEHTRALRIDRLLSQPRHQHPQRNYFADKSNVRLRRIVRTLRGVV